jgi:DinB family protein
MIEQIGWLDRHFAFDQQVGVFPILLERLRGTIARAKELSLNVSEESLATRVGNRWSVKEHIGHLLDLEPLDNQRLHEFLSRADILSPADMQNRGTENADHRHVPMTNIIARLAMGRAAFLERLGALTEKEVSIAALHPRLHKPMRLLDWIYFLAEHDDHHLALARGVLTKLKNQIPMEGVSR